MHLLGQAFPTDKSLILSVFFDLKKPSALKNIQNFKMYKNSQCENRQISKSSKKQILNPALGVHYSGCSVVPSVSSL